MKGGSESQVCIKKSVDKSFKGKQCSHLNGKRSGVALVKDFNLIYSVFTSVDPDSQH